MLRFLEYFLQKNLQKLAIFTQTYGYLCKNRIITLVFDLKNANFFRRNLAQIAENCDHNIVHSTICRPLL
jgi:hypothetical protein